MPINAYDRLVPFNPPKSYIPQSPDFKMLGDALLVKQGRFDAADAGLEANSQSLLALNDGPSTEGYSKYIRDKYEPEIEEARLQLEQTGNARGAAAVSKKIQKQFVEDEDVKILLEDVAYKKTAQELVGNPRVTGGLQRWFDPVNNKYNQMGPPGSEDRQSVQEHYGYLQTPVKSYDEYFGDIAKKTKPTIEEELKKMEIFSEIVGGEQLYFTKQSDGKKVEMTSAQLKSKLLETRGHSSWLSNLFKDNHETLNYWRIERAQNKLPVNEEALLDVLLSHGMPHYFSTTETNESISPLSTGKGNEGKETDEVDVLNLTREQIPFAIKTETQYQEAREDLLEEYNSLVASGNTAEANKANEKYLELEHDRQERIKDYDNLSGGKYTEMMDTEKELKISPRSYVSKNLEGNMGEMEEYVTEVLSRTGYTMTGGAHEGTGAEGFTKVDDYVRTDMDGTLQIDHFLNQLEFNLQHPTEEDMEKYDLGSSHYTNVSQRNSFLKKILPISDKLKNERHSLEIKHRLLKQEFEDHLENSDAMSSDVYTITQGETPDDVRKWTTFQSNWQRTPTPSFSVTSSPFADLSKTNINEDALKEILTKYGQVFGLGIDTGDLTISLDLNADGLMEHMKNLGKSDLTELKESGRSMLYFGVNSNADLKGGLLDKGSGIYASMDQYFGPGVAAQAQKNARMNAIQADVLGNDMGSYSQAVNLTGFKYIGTPTNGNKKDGTTFVQLPNGSNMTNADVFLAHSTILENRREMSGFLKLLLLAEGENPDGAERIVSQYVNFGALPETGILNEAAIGADYNNPINTSTDYRLPKRVLFEATEMYKYDSDNFTNLSGLVNGTVGNAVSTPKVSKDFEKEFRNVIDNIGFPYQITSAHRDPLSPEEINKKDPGNHTKGNAMDIVLDPSHEALFLKSMNSSASSLLSIKDQWLPVPNSTLRFKYHANNSGKGLHIHIEKK